MINTLYRTFQHWSNTGSVYIISDPHFGDTDMNWRWDLIKDYPFAVLDMLPDEEEIIYRITKYIIYQINKVCTKDDTLIILGDIGDPEYINCINDCYKVLIKGNHDKGNSFYTEYFNEIYSGPLMISDKIMLSHEPVEGPWLNIHGHVHSMQPLSIEPLSNIYDFNNNTAYIAGAINVSCEYNCFRPVNLKEIIKSGILKQIDSIHRITINRASNRENI